MNIGQPSQTQKANYFLSFQEWKTWKKCVLEKALPILQEKQPMLWQADFLDSQDSFSKPVRVLY